MEVVGDAYPAVGDGDKEEEDELDSWTNFGLGMLFEAWKRLLNIGFIMAASVCLKKSNMNAT